MDNTTKDSLVNLFFCREKILSILDNSFENGIHVHSEYIAIRLSVTTSMHALMYMLFFFQAFELLLGVVSLFVITAALPNSCISSIIHRQSYSQLN